MWLLALIAAFAAAAAPVVTIPQVQRLRVAAGLPPFPAAALARLNAPTLAAAHLQASHDLLARVTPRVAPELVAEARAAVAHDRALDKLQDLDAHLARGGHDLDKAALDHLYAGESAPGVLKDLVRDGAKSRALAAAKGMKLAPSQKARLERLAEAPVAAALESRLTEARGVLKAGDWARAWSAATALIEDVYDSGLRDNTRRMFGVAALMLQDEARNLGAPRIYGRRASDLVESVVVQRHSDCAVHQLYNHPALAHVVRLMPYRQFLRGVEKLLDTRVRSKGMTDADTARVLKALGLIPRRLSPPKDAAGLEELLRGHGPLLVSIRWTRATSFRTRGGDHAVLVREARGGRFLVVDSNWRRPQELTFEELGVLGAGGWTTVEAAGDDAAAARRFARTVPPPAPLWRRLLGLD